MRGPITRQSEAKVQDAPEKTKETKELKDQSIRRRANKRKLQTKTAAANCSGYYSQERLHVHRPKSRLCFILKMIKPSAIRE